MSAIIPIAGTPAGQTGSIFKTKLSWAKAAGIYIFNDTNFPGIANYTPGWFLLLSSDYNNTGMQISADQGTTWYGLYSDTESMQYYDGTTTVKVFDTVNPFTLYAYPF